jgi:hypothetical protein
MGDPSTNNEVQVRHEARTDREQCRSSAPSDLPELRRETKLVEELTLVTLQTADHGSTRRDSRRHNGITVRGLSQMTFAKISASLWAFGMGHRFPGAGQHAE